MRLHHTLLSLGLFFVCLSALAQSDEGRGLVLQGLAANCIDCHRFPNLPELATSASVGPVLAEIKTRHPDRSLLRSRIQDATTMHPDTIMPPYGKHRILSENEINAIVDFLYTQ